jgi:hypothetical protein
MEGQLIAALFAIAILLALAIAAIAYRIIVSSSSKQLVLVGGLIIAGLCGLELAVIQTVVERL